MNYELQVKINILIASEASFYFMQELPTQYKSIREEVPRPRERTKLNKIQLQNKS